MPIDAELLVVELTAKEAAALLDCPVQATTRRVRAIVRFLERSYGTPARWARSRRIDRAVRGYLEGLRGAAQLAAADPEALERIVRQIARRTGT